MSGIEEAAREPLTVAIAGPRPWWLDGLPDDASCRAVGLDAIAGGARADVVHVPVSDARRFRRSRPGGAALVVDATGVDARTLRRGQIRACGGADAVLVGSRHELRELRRRYPRLAPKVSLLVPPVPLDVYGTRDALEEARGNELRRFRRFHRLAAATVLFAGAYTRAGGLDLALDAISELRTRIANVRLVALPFGAIDTGYLDACERKALALGHHGIVEHRAQPAELPLWFAIADVVVFPWRRPGALDAVHRALASGRPLVAAEVEPLFDLIEDGRTGVLVPPGDPVALADAAERLLVDAVEAAELGEAARALAERELDPRVSADRLLAVWTSAAEGARRRAPTGERAVAAGALA